MGLRADSVRPQRLSGSARTDSRRAESAHNPIASHVKFGDDSALSALTLGSGETIYLLFIVWPLVAV